MLNVVPTHSKRSVASEAFDINTSTDEAKSIYFALVNKQEHRQERLLQQSDDPVLSLSRDFLSNQLEQARKLTCDLPGSIGKLPGWIEQNTHQVGREYRAYLQTRKAGGPRRYFSSKSHALYFLQSVAPTKLVDGSWLYGMLKGWNDARFTALIRIYLEELGEGLPDKNHVVLYRKLLASHGCEQWPHLNDKHFIQGAIQLSLGHLAADFLPEVIGFNLGYEQLPLHLLITAYELNELGIDPYYFTLHVTVDNAATGHAQKSLQSVLQALPRVADADEFYRRVIDGYKLNMLGESTLSVIQAFDLQKELLSVLASKAAVGSQLHSDYCRIGGRTVNEWLSEPGQLPDFLASLEQMGWIKRHQDPQNSRFWRLIHGERAEMFGVFTPYEQQLIHDWISGEASELSSGKARPLTFKARQRLLDNLNQCTSGRLHGTAARGIFRQHGAHSRAANDADDFDMELRLLEEKLTGLSSKEELMASLAQLMSPANHHTASGLMATRIFTRLFG